MDRIVTPRLSLEPITLDLVEAVFAQDRERVERMVSAKIPAAWPGRVLVERAFSASLDAIRRDPAIRLWGDRLILTRPEAGAPDGARLLVGSVIFHGAPDEQGVVEIGYGVEESWQSRGIATEATSAAVRWALAQPRVTRVAATTVPWHTASIRVLEKSGLVRTSIEEHESLGEVLRFETTRSDGVR